MSVPKSPAAPAKPRSNGAAHVSYIARGENLRYDPDATFTESVMNVAQGIELALELAHSSALERLGAGQGGEASPVLSTSDTDIMMRFALEAARLLAASAEQHLDYIQEFPRKGGK